MEQAKDFDTLTICIFNSTKRRIGATTLKRLFGHIGDERNANAFTLNTIAQYLGYESWDSYLSVSMNSEENFDDNSIYIDQLAIGQKVRITYLNRVVDFIVIASNGVKVLKVLFAQNSSLCKDDQLHIFRIKVGEILKAPSLVRNGRIGNYRTKGIVNKIELFL